MEKRNNFPDNLAKPAQRALANAGVTSLQQLSNYSEKEIADLHGMGPNALTKIKQALLENSLSFADK
jgi:DNA-directed RNA polymerase alpha subunit